MYVIPWAGDCKREDCFPCRSGNMGKCHKTNINYKIDCKECLENGPSLRVHSREELTPVTEAAAATTTVSEPKRSTYWGESARNGYTRGKEHLADIRTRNERNAMWKHCVEHHEGEEVEFNMRITASFKDPLTRLVREGVNIVAGNEDILMNSKAEFRQGAVGRISIRRGLDEQPSIPI